MQTRHVHWLELCTTEELEESMSRFIKAIADRIIVSPIEPESMSEGGIILGESKERPCAVILSVGDAVEDQSLKAGQVIFGKRDLSVEFVFDGLPGASIGIESVIGVVDNEMDVEVVFHNRRTVEA